MHPRCRKYQKLPNKKEYSKKFQIVTNRVLQSPNRRQCTESWEDGLHRSEGSHSQTHCHDQRGWSDRRADRPSEEGEWLWSWTFRQIKSGQVVLIDQTDWRPIIRIPISIVSEFISWKQKKQTKTTTTTTTTGGHLGASAVQYHRRGSSAPPTGDVADGGRCIPDQVRICIYIFANLRWEILHLSFYWSYF